MSWFVMQPMNKYTLHYNNEMLANKKMEVTKIIIVRDEKIRR